MTDEKNKGLIDAFIKFLLDYHKKPKIDKKSAVKYYEIILFCIRSNPNLVKDEEKENFLEKSGQILGVNERRGGVYDQMKRKLDDVQILGQISGRNFNEKREIVEKHLDDQKMFMAWKLLNAIESSTIPEKLDLSSEEKEIIIDNLICYGSSFHLDNLIQNVLSQEFAEEIEKQRNQCKYSKENIKKMFKPEFQIVIEYLELIRSDQKIPKSLDIKVLVSIFSGFITDQKMTEMKIQDFSVSRENGQVITWLAIVYLTNNMNFNMKNSNRAKLSNCIGDLLKNEISKEDFDILTESVDLENFLSIKSEMTETVENDKEQLQKPEDDGNRRLKKQRKERQCDKCRLWISETMPFKHHNQYCAAKTGFHGNFHNGYGHFSRPFYQSRPPSVQKRYYSPTIEARNHPTEKKKQKPECLIVE